MNQSWRVRLGVKVSVKVGNRIRIKFGFRVRTRAGVMDLGRKRDRHEDREPINPKMGRHE